MSKNCVFISVGDRERFASFCTEELAERYDIFINYYGDDNEKMKRLAKSSLMVFSMKTTKFISLKSIFKQAIENKYEWVAVFDDDAKFISGSMDDLVSAGKDFSLDVVSGAHVGKVSHPQVHRRVEGCHRMRMVNFVEMNFPVFREEALSRYMKIYDGKLCGWGNDWWYCNVFETNKRAVAGVVDSVVIENPTSNGEMERFMKHDDRMNQWNETKLRLGLSEWKRQTIFMV